MSDHGDELRDALKRVGSKPLREALQRGFAKEADRRRREAQPTFRAWMGAWQRDRTYKPGDVVEHLGSSWRCMVEHRDSEPPSVMWEVVAEKGDNGPGGVMGPIGPQGPAGAGGTPSNSVVTEQTFGQADTPGVSLEFSRGDHTHGTPDDPGGATPASSVEDETTFGIAPAVGTDLEYARQDHTHGSPTAPTVPTAGNTVVSETTFGQAAAGGTDPNFSREDHTHGTPAAPSVPTAANAVVTETSFGQASAVGVNATEFAREDHTHGTPAAPSGGTPATTVEDETSFGITPAVGTDLEYARQDHTHGSPTAPDIPDPASSVTDETSFGIAPDVGTGTDYARDDHTHGTPAAPSVPVAATTVTDETTFGIAPATGVDTDYAREDHTHGSPTNPVPAHVAAADPHPGYIQESLFDAKGDIITASANDTPFKTTVGADDTILMADAAAGGGVKWVASGTPSTQAFGDSAVVGTSDTFTRGDHKHAMPADPVTAHVAASDPHPGYLTPTEGDAAYLAKGSLTDGSVLFAASGQVAQDNANLFYDNANDNLLLGTNTTLDAGVRLQVVGKASEKTVIFRANATTPGNILEAQTSDGVARLYVPAVANGQIVFQGASDVPRAAVGAPSVAAHKAAFWNATLAELEANFAITQGPAGDTELNAVSGQPISFWTGRVTNGFVLTGSLLTFHDATNLAFDTTTGTKIGTATGQKLAFWNATPIIQPTNTAALDVILDSTGLRAGSGTDVRLSKKLYPATDAAATQTAAGIYAGSGVPNNANGADGDFFLRSAGTQAAGTTVYHKEAGVWVVLQALDHDHDGSPTQQLLAANTHGSPSADTHHNKSHTHDGADGSGTVDYTDLASLPTLERLLAVVVLTGSGTYTVPAGVTALMVEAIGGGGGGGGAATAAVSGAAGSGGGGGGYAREFIATPAASYAYAVGTAGSAGTAGNNAGGNGGDSTFGTVSVCTAKGGIGGGGSAAGTTNAFTNLGGLGGAAASGVGDVLLSGAPGDAGYRISGTGGVRSGKGGMAAGGGGGGREMILAGAGNAGGQYGGGGSGGAVLNGSAAVAGGAGAAGTIVVYEYGP